MLLLNDPTSLPAIGAQYGGIVAVLVAILYLYISGRQVSGKEFDRVVAEKTELQKAFPDMLVALAASTAALQEATRVMRDVIVEMQMYRRLP